MEPEVFVQSLLVFSCKIRFFLVVLYFYLKTRMVTQNEAIRLMEIMTAQFRIILALRAKVLRDIDLVVENSDKVRIYGEIDRKRIGAFPVIQVD